MARGGSRPGAGRRQGAVGRATNKAKIEADKTGETPVEYMLRVMRDPVTDDRRRDDMAKAAAPYCHRKLATTEVTGPDGGPVQIERVERRIIDPANGDRGEGPNPSD